MKKRITWNSAQTWVIKIVKNHGLIRRQQSAYHAKSGSKCYVIDRLIATRVVWILRTPWCSRSAARCKEQYREFSLINHRPSGNLGFWTLRAENQCSGFYEQILPIYCMSAEFCRYNTLATSQNPSVNFWSQEKMWFCAEKWYEKLPFRDRPPFSRLDAPL